MRLISPVLWLWLLGIMLLLLLLLLLLIVPMVVAGDARLLDRRSLVAPPGLVLAVAGGDHALLRDGLRHGNRGRGLGSSVHRPGGTGVGHHSESPVTSPG